MSKETNTKKTSTKKNEKEVKNKNTKSKDTKKDTKKKEVKKEEKVVTEKKVEIVDEYDEDLDDYFAKDEEIVVEVKNKKEDNKNKEDSKKIKEEAKKIKEEAKAKKKEEKELKKQAKLAKKEEKLKLKENVQKKSKVKNKKNSKLIKYGEFLEKNRFIIASFIIGVIVTALIAMLLWPERIATLKNGEEPIVKVGKNTYTADSLYTRMKNHYNVSQLLDQIDSDLLTKLYPEDKEMTDEVKQNAEYYINMYKQYYNYTEEQFLSSNGFASYNDFLEYLKLENRRKKYLDKYVKDNLTDKEIENYYNKNVYGDINCQHILVETTSDTSSDSSNKKLSDEEGKKLAEEIITKINDGTSWDDIKKEYKDKTTFEDLGYQSWDSDLETPFKTALKEMDDKSFSKEPVKTSYGYHVIYRIDQKKVESLKKTKDKIVTKLVEEKKAADSNLQQKALISLRQEKNIKFYDTDMGTKYEAFKKQYK